MTTAKRSKVAAKPKRKPRGKPFTGADDPRRNVGNRPKDDDSWAGTLRTIQAMKPEEIVEWVSGPLAMQFKKMPQGVTLKQIISLRWLSAQIDEPTIGLIRELIDRTDGPVPSVLQGDKDKPLAFEDVGTNARELLISRIAGIEARLNQERSTGEPER